MKHKPLLLILAALMLSIPFARADEQQEVQQPPKVIVSLDREDALYEIGDKVAFTITVAHEDGSPVRGVMNIQLNCSLDPGRPLSGSWVKKEGEPEKWVRRDTQTWITIEDGGSETIEYTLEEPGFVIFTAIGRSWEGEREYIKSVAAAACEPDKIEPVVTMPDDFDEFWEKGRERLAEIPLDYRQERIDHLCDDMQDTYKVSFANIDDTRIYGYLLIPKTGKDKYPALVSVAPAGIGKPPENFVDGRLNNMARNEAICLFMGVYDHELGRSKEYYANYEGHGPATLVEDPEDYFFYRATLGIDRAIDWLAQREDFDGEHLVYTGNSQGGGVGLILTGLNKNITASNVNIPGLCDHLAFLEGRSPGWPGVLNNLRHRPMSEEVIETAMEMLPYFDAVNFARRIDVPVLMTMGFQDTTCPPDGVYSAFNVIEAPKRMIANPHGGHGVWREAQEIIAPWIRAKLGLSDEEIEP